MLNGQPGLPDRDGVTLETSFVGPGMRRSPRLSYVPSRLSLVPTLLRRDSCRRTWWCCTRRRRATAKVSLGVEVNVLPAAIEAAKRRGGVVVAQVNDRMPWTYGDAVVDLDLVDVLVEADEPLPTAPVTAIDDASARIGELVAERVADGATLQAGIGAVPDATLRGLRDRSGLRVWTEMFSDSVLALEKVGALDRNVPITASFLFGSPELLEWVDGNERIQMVRTETTNSPALIAAQPGDGQRQHRSPGRPLRPGERLADRRPHPLRLRRPDRLHRRRAAQQPAARRSSRCGRGTRRPTARRSCRWSTSR